MKVNVFILRIVWSLKRCLANSSPSYPSYHLIVRLNSDTLCGCLTPTASFRLRLFPPGTCALCPWQRFLVVPCQNAAVVFRARVQLHITRQLEGKTCNVHDVNMFQHVSFIVAD